MSVRQARQLQRIRADGKAVTPGFFDRAWDLLRQTLDEHTREYRDLVNGVNGDVLAGSFSYDGLRDLKADPEDMAQCFGISSARDGGEGLFVSVEGDITTVGGDNGGTIIASGRDDRYWKRTTDRQARASWFGVKGDGGIYTTQMQAAINYCLGLDATRERTLLLPRGVVKCGYLAFDDTAAGYPYSGFTMEGEGCATGNSAFRTWLQYVGTGNATWLDMIGLTNFRFNGMVWNGNGLTNKICWVRPKFSGATLVSGPYNGVFEEIQFVGMGDYANSVGLSLGDIAHPNVQVSEIRTQKCDFISYVFGVNPITGWRTETKGNVKNFWIERTSFQGLALGVDWTEGAGVLHILNSPCQSNTLDFKLSGSFTITACPTEGGDKRLEAPGAAAAYHGTMSGCTADMTGVVDNIMDIGCALTLDNNEFSNTSLAGVVKEARINVTEPLWGSVMSQNNTFYGSKSFPLFFGAQRVVAGATNAVGSTSQRDDANMYPGPTDRYFVFQSKGDKGNALGLGNVVTHRFPPIENPQTSYWSGGLSTRSITDGGAGWCDTIGITWTPINHKSWRVSIAKEAFYAAALTQTIAVGNIWTKTKFTCAIADVKTAFTGVAGPLSCSVGWTSPTSAVVGTDVDGYLLAFNAASAGVRGAVDADMGVGLALATRPIADGILWWDTSAAYHRNLITVTFTGAGNLGNGATTNLTAGAIELIVSFEIFS